MTWYKVEIEAELVLFIDAPDSETKETGVTKYVLGYESVWDVYEVDTDSMDKATDRATDRFNKEYTDEYREIMDDSLKIEVAEIKVN